MGPVGLVAGLEVSRLARNSSDWHRLLEICAFSDTLILDEDGLYDPAHFNDRLLLGLKGTMSEAELHVMQARMRGGLLSKARRGELHVPLPIALLYDAQVPVVLHPGHIAWEEYQEDQRRLRENAHAVGPEGRKSPPREGPALLQGLAICGVCGGRMKVTYHVRVGHGRSVPDYVCEGRSVDDPQPGCQWIPGAAVDQAISELLLEIMSPVAIEITLAVQQELQARSEEVDRLRQEQVEHARYEAELAQRRYMRVDPDRRLVADSLEAHWNRELCTLHDAQQH